MSSGTVFVSDGHNNLEFAIRKLKRYFVENLQKELRMRAGYVDRRKVKRTYALRRFKKRQKEILRREGEK